MTPKFFHDMVTDLFQEYLPKIKKQERMDFQQALLEELESNGVDFEEDEEDEEDVKTNDYFKVEDL